MNSTPDIPRTMPAEPICVNPRLYDVKVEFRHYPRGTAEDPETFEIVVQVHAYSAEDAAFQANHALKDFKIRDAVVGAARNLMLASWKTIDIAPHGAPFTPDATAPCDDCGGRGQTLITKGDHHGGTKTVCADRAACHARSRR